MSAYFRQAFHAIRQQQIIPQIIKKLLKATIINF